MPNKRRVIRMGVAAATACAALGLGSVAPTQAATSPAHAVSAAPTPVVLQQVSLRLYADASQVATVAATPQNYVPVIEQTWGNAIQRWDVTSVGGHFRFESHYSGKCLNVRDNSTAPGAEMIVYTCGTDSNELWSLVGNGRGYQIVSLRSGLCLAVQGAVGRGRQLIQNVCSRNAAPTDTWLPVWQQPTA